MINFAIDNAQTLRLERALGEKAKRLPIELKIAVNATAKKTKPAISKEVRKELAAPAKAVNQTISIQSKATNTEASAKVLVKKTRRIPLRDFGARQNKRGVSYRISKSQGRKTIYGAFQGPKPGVMKTSWKGNVFQRVGKSRLPIVKLYGPSPWGVVVKKKLKPVVQKDAKKELRKQIERRIRFQNLKRSGAI